MRLPFFRAKSAADQPPNSVRAARGKAAAAAAAGLSDDAPAQAARTRARRRLIGALVLLVAGVIGFPILFETQPRPLPVETPYLVGEGAAVRVVPAPAARPLPTLPADAGRESAEDAPPQPGTAASANTAAAGSTVAAPDKAASALTNADQPSPKPASPKSDPPRAEAARSEPAKAEGAKLPLPDAASASAAAGRFVVQVGAYNDVERLRAARQKLEKLGLKSYTQDVETAGGKRTRVRLGPFPSRQEADAVAAKVKASGMQANILAL